jgi:hypothetical protein
VAIPVGTERILPITVDHLLVGNSYATFPCQKDLSSVLSGDSAFKSCISTASNVTVYDPVLDIERPRIVSLDLATNKLFIAFDGAIDNINDKEFWVCVGSGISASDSPNTFSNSNYMRNWRLDEFITGNHAEDVDNDYAINDGGGSIVVEPGQSGNSVRNIAPGYLRINSAGGNSPYLNEINGKTKLTFEMCFKYSSTSVSDYATFFIKYGSSSYQLSCYFYSTYLVLAIGNSGTYGVGYVAKSAFILNGWNHLVWLYDGTGTGNSGRLKCMLNGSIYTLTYSGTVPSSINAGGSSYFYLIGYNSLTNPNNLDSLGIINGVTTNDFLTTRYNQYSDDAFWTIEESYDPFTTTGPPTTTTTTTTTLAPTTTTTTTTTHGPYVFDDAAIATVRKPRGKLIIVWTDPFIDRSLLLTASTENRASVINHAADMVTTTPYKYAVIDNSFILDGTFHPFPGTTLEKSNYQVGWYGNKFSYPGGVFSSPYPTLTLSFDPRPIFGIFLIGEPTLGEYPVDFTVQVYNDTTLVTTITITDNDSVEFNQEFTVPTATKIVLTITKWSRVGTVCKIVEFYTRVVRVYEGDDIVSMNLLEEREIRDGSLPVGNISSNELDFELQNVKLLDIATEIIDPFFPGNTDSWLSYLVLPNRRVYAYLGFEFPDGTVEYKPIGTFFTSDWNIDDDSFSVSSSCRDRMEILRQGTFSCSQVYENITLYDLAEIVLNDAKTNIPMADLVWSIDEELENYTVATAWFEKKNYMEAIRDIAEACLGQAYMNKVDVLIIESSAINLTDTESYDYLITKDNYFSKKQPSKTSEIQNVVHVETQPLIKLEDAENVYTSEESIAIEPFETLAAIEIKYTDSPIADAVASFIEYGSLILDYSVETYYPWGASLTVTNISPYSGTFKISVSGKKYIIDGTEIITRPSTENSASIRTYGKLEYTYPKNHLVQTKDVAEKIADALIASYAIERKDIELNWRGNPSINLGHIIKVPIYQKGSIDNYGNFIVYKNKLDFDGTLSGTISGRKITQYDPPLLVMQDSDNSSVKYQDSDNGTESWKDTD